MQQLLFKRISQISHSIYALCTGEGVVAFGGTPYVLARTPTSDSYYYPPFHDVVHIEFLKSQTSLNLTLFFGENICIENAKHIRFITTYSFIIYIFTTTDFSKNLYALFFCKYYYYSQIATYSKIASYMKLCCAIGILS